MTVSKRNFFSIELQPDVIRYQAILWNKYLTLNEDKINSTHNLSLGANISIEDKIILYSTSNSQIENLLGLIYHEMLGQGEELDRFEFAENRIFREQIIFALKFISTLDGSWEIAINKFINNIVIVKCDNFIAASSYKFLGTIVISPKNHWKFCDYIENLVHEISHIDLYIKQLIDPLIKSNNFLESPFRKQKRPAIGVLHSAFVLIRVALVLTKLIDIDPNNNDTINCYIVCYKNLTLALNSLENSGFTELGKFLFSEMQKSKQQLDSFNMMRVENVSPRNQSTN